MLRVIGTALMHCTSIPMVNTALGIQALNKTAQECRVKNMAVNPVHRLEWFKVLVA